MDIKDLAPGTAVHEKGKRRVQEILQVATEVLAYEGYSNFTMRGIADRLGIKLRNVQYYFKTKENLFQAVIDQRLKRDIETAQQVVNREGLTDEERFLAFVDLSLEENTTPFFRGLQFELWALANHDAFAAQCRDRMTMAYSNFIYELIKPLTAGQSDKVRKEKSVILLAMLQGFPLIEGSDVNIEFNLGNVRELFRDQAIRFVKTKY
ncbi:MAG TPA: TetR/AcrR family transcriptional regulator [Sphingomonadales bacterium]